MKVKLVVLDLELSQPARRAATAVAGALLALGAGAIAYANVPHTWTDGDTLTAADLNGSFTSVDARITALEQPSRSAVVAHKTTAQTVATGTMSILTFDSESFDVNNEFDPATGSFTAKRDGYYHVDCAAVFNPHDNVSGCVVLDILQDGRVAAETYSCGALGASPVATSSLVHLAATGVVSCQVGNQLAANETVGGSLPFQAARVFIAIVGVR